MKHTDIVDVLTDATRIGEEVTVCGWVRTARDSKNMAFLELNDGTSLRHLQVVLDKTAVSIAPECFHQSAAVQARGQIVAARQGGVEINATEVTLIGDCPLDYPLQKKRQTVEFLRTIPHLRVRTNTFNAVFRTRSVLSMAIHQFFQDRHFVYAHTPIITSSDCEGAGEMFRVTTHGSENPFASEAEYYAADFFGQKAGLSVSGQLEGETAACAFGKIYTFGPTFRAEKSNTARHVAEFWQIEPEVAFMDLSEVIGLAQEMIQFIVAETARRCPEEIQFFTKFFDAAIPEKIRTIVEEEFAVLDYTEAIPLLEKADVDFQYPVFWGCDLQTEHERYIAEQIFGKPVFLTNYPKDIKAFYMKQNPDGKTVAATDLLLPGVGEIIGCSEREADEQKLRQAIEDRHMALEDYENYLDLRRFGSVPHSGFGLGLERLLMYLTGISNIRDVILYPRVVGTIY